MAYAVPDPYARAIRSGLKYTCTVDAVYNGSPVAGATGLQPTGGSVTDTTKPGVRRLLSAEFAGGQSLYGLLRPLGTQLVVTAHLRYTAQQVQDIPMGVFDIDADTLSEADGKVSVTAPDKWVKVQRARFLSPTASTRGALVTDQIASLIRGALGASEPVVVTATSTATVPALTWDSDRAQAIIDLATSIGAWVFFDRSGAATIADAPGPGVGAAWLTDASPTGVLVSLDRSQSRSNTHNVVVVESSASSGQLFPTQYVWDNDPNSPTFAGPGPGYGPITSLPAASSAGPFGQVPYFYSTPILSNAAQAVNAGRTILARTVGLAATASWDQVPNPAADAFDAFSVLPPGVSHYVPGSGGPAVYPSPTLYSSPASYPGAGGVPVPPSFYVTNRVLERHVADTITHSLTGAAMAVQGRSTRTDPYTDQGGY